MILIVTSDVVDRHRFDADPDPTFHFDGDPDTDPDPTLSYTQVVKSRPDKENILSAGLASGTVPYRYQPYVNLLKQAPL
jgi:hypothetical protein